MEQHALNMILQDALLFFMLFGIMSIISIIVTKRDAKNYELNHPLQGRIDAANEKRLVSMHLNSSRTKMKGSTAILLELSGLLKEKIINQEEYQTLKLNIHTNSNT